MAIQPGWCHKWINVENNLPNASNVCYFWFIWSKLWSSIRTKSTADVTEPSFSLIVTLCVLKSLQSIMTNLLVCQQSWERRSDELFGFIETLSKRLNHIIWKLINHWMKCKTISINYKQKLNISWNDLLFSIESRILCSKNWKSNPFEVNYLINSRDRTRNRL